MAVGWNRQDYMRMVMIRRIGREKRLYERALRVKTHVEGAQCGPV